MNRLSDEILIEVLMYLRATELAILCETNKEIFSRYRIGTAIRRIVKPPAALDAFPSSFKKHIVNLQNAKGLLSPESLYAFEAAIILISLSYPQPLLGKGKFLISKGVVIKYFVNATICCS